MLLSFRYFTNVNSTVCRFCTKDYHPFDANDLKKYVVGDDYTPPREVSTSLLGFAHSGTKRPFDRSFLSDSRIQRYIFKGKVFAARYALAIFTLAR